jgi:hypothetical protein
VLRSVVGWMREHSDLQGDRVMHAMIPLGGLTRSEQTWLWPLVLDVSNGALDCAYPGLRQTRLKGSSAPQVAS